MLSNLNTNYTKHIYQNSNIVYYYETLTKNIGVIDSEKIIINRFIKENDFVLDIGCGVGRTTNYIDSICHNVIGVDVSENMILRAKKLYPNLNFHVQDAIDLKLSQGVFDIVNFSFNGIMTIPGCKNRNKAILEVHRVLKPNGLFLFSTPFLDNKRNSEFWLHEKEKYNDSSNYEFGDIFLSDNEVNNIYIHMPELKEISHLLLNNNFNILFKKRRLDIVKEDDCIEEYLDDNYCWVAQKNE